MEDDIDSDDIGDDDADVTTNDQLSINNDNYFPY